jgi:flagellar biosynthetic protein FliP
MIAFTMAAALDLGGLNAGNEPLSLPLQILVLMTGLTVLPTLLLMMTGFTRILIVLSILRQALGLQQTPPNQVLVGMALFLTLFVMRPVVAEIDKTAWQPYRTQALPMETAIERGGVALHGFMARQTRSADLSLFYRMGNEKPGGNIATTPFSILVPAFVTSELKTAFQIGFMIFLPFLVIDLVVASALMALGMMMLSPSVVSMPFKLLLFVAIDGWALTMGSLAASFGNG